MFAYLLPLHSAVRWLVLIILIAAIVRSYYAYKKAIPYRKADKRLRELTTAILNIQLLIGLWLYSISPMVRYFLQNFQKGVKLREIRFFGMEHSLMMLIAVILVSIGSAKARKQRTDAHKFRTQWLWYGIALLVILSSIPWSFSPLTSRPLIRWF